ARVAHLGRLLLGRDRAEGAQEIAHRLGADQGGLDAGHARLARSLRALGPLLGLGAPAGEREPEQHGEKVSHGAAPAASITSASASCAPASSAAWVPCSRLKIGRGTDTPPPTMCSWSCSSR